MSSWLVMLWWPVLRNRRRDTGSDEAGECGAGNVQRASISRWRDCMALIRRASAARPFMAAGATILMLSLMGIGLWPTSAGANAAMAAAGAAAKSAADKCGAQFQGAALYSCLAGVVDQLATRIQGEGGNVGASLAAQMRSAAATVRQANKQTSVGALSQLRSAIGGVAARFKSQGRDETPGMNALQSAISTTIRWVQTKG